MTTECATRTQRVVLVEDCPDVRYLLVHALEADGRFEVVGEAATAADGLVRAIAEEPDIVLVDLTLEREPDQEGGVVRDGSWLLAALRRSLPGTPLVAVTGSSDEAAHAGALAAGADSVLVKRDLTSTLIDRIHDLAHARLAEPRSPAGPARSRRGRLRVSSGARSGN